MRRNESDRIRKFTSAMWAKWLKDRTPDEHTIKLSEGIEQTRKALSHHDVVPVSTKPTREQVKDRAREIDPNAWVSYSGKPIQEKRDMDRRRSATLRQAENELGNWRIPV